MERRANDYNRGLFSIKHKPYLEAGSQMGGSIELDPFGALVKQLGDGYTPKVGVAASNGVAD